MTPAARGLGPRAPDPTASTPASTNPRTLGGLPASQTEAGSERLWTSRFLLVLLLLCLYRLAATIWPGMDLFPDEAYYHGWSTALDLGYYSKPPMVALLIRAATELFGEHEAAIRSAALLCYALASVFVYLTARLLYDPRIGFLCGITFLTLPLVGFFSRFITTDAPLMLFWTAALYAYVRADRHDRLVDWSLAGLAAGLGLQSKYTMIVFAVCVFAHLLSSASRRRRLLKPGFNLAWLIALLVFLPNVWWNARHDFVSFSHTAEISQLDRELLHPDKLLEFTASQLLVFGPLCFPLLVVLTTQIGRWWRDDRLRLLMLFSLPFLALIMLQSLLSRAFYNWAAPTYAAASIAITAWLCAPSTTQASIPAQDTAPDSARGERSWLWRAAVALNLVLCVAIYHYDGVARVVGIELGARADLYSRLRGWSEAGAALDRLLDSTPNSPIIFDDRKTMAALLYYAPRARGRGHMWNPDGRITDHYRFRVDARQVLGQAVVLVVQHLPREYLAERFSQLTEAGTIRIRTHPDAIRELRVYTAERFEHY